MEPTLTIDPPLPARRIRSHSLHHEERPGQVDVNDFPENFDREIFKGPGDFRRSARLRIQTGIVDERIGDAPHGFQGIEGVLNRGFVRDIDREEGEPVTAVDVLEDFLDLAVGDVPGEHGDLGASAVELLDEFGTDLPKPARHHDNFLFDGEQLVIHF
ncbi:hypothetical protein AHiyo6_01850 [Arthrobacter sp. Hiyo6]|nr:hypothetical protein AHiyo6_01850 [Arthrobacter sp. Hiyo6]